jgi:hypothetical protein
MLMGVSGVGARLRCVEERDDNGLSPPLLGRPDIVAFGKRLASRARKLARRPFRAEYWAACGTGYRWIRRALAGRTTTLSTSRL